MTLKLKFMMVLAGLVWFEAAVNSKAASLPTITAQPASQTVTAGSMVILNVSASGSGPINFQWLLNGKDPSGDGSRPAEPATATTGRADPAGANGIPAAPTEDNPVPSSNQRIKICAACCTYIIRAAEAANAGDYSVRITSAAGTETSAVATLKVVGLAAKPASLVTPLTGSRTPPEINLASGAFDPRKPFGFSLSGVKGQTMVVEGSTNGLDWTPLYTNSATGIPFYFSDPESTKFPARFYRARLQ